MDGLQISLLGLPTISWGEKVLSFPRRQVRALLYRLSTNLQAVSREELCFLFWSEEPPSSARRNLTHLLTHLRLALPAPDLVFITKENVALDPQRVCSDTAEFDRLLAQHKAAAPATDPAVVDLKLVLEALEKAIQFYRGPFLNGFTLPGCQEFDAWISRERRGYECRYLEVLQDLVEIYQDYKDYEAAIAYAGRYLEIDPLAENVHSKLIELYAAKGDRSAAERQFEQLTAVLEQELGISPSPKTWALYQSVLGTRMPEILLPSLALANGSRSKLDIPFVGRQETLKQINRAFNLACLGRSKVILINGEPGIGKSRLIQQIASQYHRKASILFSACNPGMGDLPYHPVAEAFRSSLETHAPSLKVSPIWLAEAARLLPEIYTHFPDLPQPPPAKSEEARRRLYEALCQLTFGLGTKCCPLILCLDDLHWADTTTLEWLIYLGNRLAFEGLSYVLIICTCRSDEKSRLDDLCFTLNRLGVMEEVHLDGLETDEVLELLCHFSASNDNSLALATKLQQISRGNPFYLIETLRILIEDHRIPIKSGDLDNIPVSKTIQGVVHQLLASLDLNQQKILEIAAVMNQPFTIDTLQMCLERSEAEILDSLETLTNRRILIEQDGKYQFHHELVRMAIYEDLGYDRRRFLHHQCGKALEQMHPNEVALLAWHFEQSGESNKAAGYALQAGENARKIYAFPEALDFFSRALNSLKQEAAILKSHEALSLNYRKQIMALSQRGSAFRALGDMQSYQNDFEEVARIARVLGDGKVLAQVHLREAYAHRWFCRYPQARQSAEKALQMGREAGNALLQARAMREIGLAARAVGDFSDARTILEDALQRFRELEETGYEIHTLCNLSTLHAYVGDFSRSEQLAANALGRCDAANLPYLRRIALGDLGIALTGLGQVSQARDCLLASLEIARQIADRTQEIFCLCHLGWLENHAGQPEEALRYLRDGLALAERLDSRAEQSRLEAGLAEAFRLLKNARLAKSFAYKALELANRHGRLYDQGLAQRILAELKESV